MEGMHGRQSSHMALPCSEGSMEMFILVGYAQTAAVNVSFYCQRAIWRTCSSYEIPTIVYTIQKTEVSFAISSEREVEF